MRTLPHSILVLFILAAPAFANVVVRSPGNGETVTSPAHYEATAATSTCSRGVASIGVYVDNQLIYVVDGTSLDTDVSISSGKHDTVVQAWDYCGGVTLTHVRVTVSSQTGVWVTSPANNSIVS